MDAIFLDIETTGLDPYIHTILEIAFKIVDLSSGDTKAVYHSIIKQTEEIWNQRDLTSTEINGFTWEKLQQVKEINDVKNEIFSLYQQLTIQRGKFFYICQNPSFDRCFFAQLFPVSFQESHLWPYHWLDLASMYWALQVKEQQLKNLKLSKEMSVSKNSIAKNFHLPAEVNPHTAINGVDHLILCYKHVVGFCE